jgi:sugar porter (SP) family MFS transporter
MSRASVAKASVSAKSYFIIIAMVAALAGLLFGYDTGVISGAILFIRNDFQLSPLGNGMVVSSVLFGALVGALFSGRMTDYYGRKMILIVVSLLFVLGTLESALAPNEPALIMGRIAVGVAIGIASYAAPLYISEISPPRYRGALVSLNQLAIGIGILASYVVDYVFAPQQAWRMMLGFGVIPAVLLFIGLLFLPRSPRWMVSQGYYGKALEILHRLRGGLDIAEKELESIRATVTKERMEWKILFSNTIRPVVVIGIGLAVLQQVTGINTILYYAPTILTMTGYQGATGAILSTMGIGAVFVIFTIISLPLIDVLGRRILLIAGLIGMACGLLVMAYSFHAVQSSSVIHWLTLGGMLVYIASFAFSLGPIMWLMIAEIYPLKVRGLGASLATCCNWLSNLIVAFTFLSIVNAIGVSSTFMIYFVMCLVSIVFVYFFVPETKSITLEHFESNLLSGKKWRQLSDK